MSLVIRIDLFQRLELQKFMKMMRQRRPLSKFSLQYDKLIIDNEIYMFNDLTGRVEEVSESSLTMLRSFSFGLFLKAAGGRVSPGVTMADNVSMNNMTGATLDPPLSANSARIRARSQTRKDRSNARLQKSFSTESSLNHLVPNSPVHPNKGYPHKVHSMR